MIKMIRKIINLTISLLVLMPSISFSQNDTVPIVAPKLTVPLLGNDWTTLKPAEKVLLKSIKSKIETIKHESDSCFELIVDYLISEDDLTNYKGIEFAKLIYELPGDKPLVFLLNNIDVLIGVVYEMGSYNRLKVYPFFHVFRIDSLPSRMDEIVSILVDSNILNDCELTGMKLNLISLLFDLPKGYIHKDSMEKYLMKADYKKEISDCKRKNLESILNKKYPNLDRSQKIKRE